MIAAALFDLDGTLVETEQVLYRAWTELAKRAGADFRAFPYRTIIGKPDLECCHIVSEHFALGKDAAEWYREFHTLSMSMMDELTLRPGAEEVIDVLTQKGIPLALVTSSVREWAKSTLDRFDLFDAFRVHVTADSPGLRARKPDPAPYLLAAELLGVDPKRCIAFEDSPTGVESALAAGCYTHGIPHQLSVSSGLARAHRVLHDLSSFDFDRVRFEE